MTKPDDHARGLADHMPRLRHYARALSGDAQTGDSYALAALEAFASDPQGIAPGHISERIGLFRAFHGLWESTHSSSSPEQFGMHPDAIVGLPSSTREALLLHLLEGFSIDEVATILGIDRKEARYRVESGRLQLADGDPGAVLIIEDEPIIAMNLEDLVSEAGHRVTGLARTREAAVKLGLAERPDLILADMQLADRSSGRDAVQDLTTIFGDIPVIFITAFPERLLTGDGAEPTFLISKPFEEEAVRIALAQALYFAGPDARMASA